MSAPVNYQLPDWSFPTELIEPVESFSSDLIDRIKCVLLVINQNELHGVFRLLKPLPNGQILRTNISHVTTYAGILGKQTVAVAQCGTSGSYAGSVHNTIHALVSILSPVAVINVGVAFGAKEEKQHIGDVLVSTKMIDYSTIRSNDDGSITDRGVRTEAGVHLIDRVRTASNELGNVLKVELGPILSGPVLMDNAQMRADLLKRIGEGIGGEMEGIALYTACEALTIEWIIIKGICDWGNGTKEKASQPFAALQAAKLVEHMLKDPFVWKGFPVIVRHTQVHPVPVPVEPSLPPVYVPPPGPQPLTLAEGVVAGILADYSFQPERVRECSGCHHTVMHFVKNFGAPLSLFGLPGQRKTTSCGCRLARHLAEKNGGGKGMCGCETTHDN